MMLGRFERRALSRGLLAGAVATGAATSINKVARAGQNGRRPTTEPAGRPGRRDGRRCGDGTPRDRPAFRCRVRAHRAPDPYQPGGHGRRGNRRGGRGGRDTKDVARCSTSGRPQAGSHPDSLAAFADGRRVVGTREPGRRERARRRSGRHDPEATSGCADHGDRGGGRPRSRAPRTRPMAHARSAWPEGTVR